MRRTEPIAVGELLKTVAGSHPKLAQLFLEARVEEAWRALDPTIDAQTTRATFAGGKLNVWIASPALRHELFMRRTELVRQVNETLGTEVVKAIYVK